MQKNMIPPIYKSIYQLTYPYYREIFVEFILIPQREFRKQSTCGTKFFTYSISSESSFKCISPDGPLVSLYHNILYHNIFAWYSHNPLKLWNSQFHGNLDVLKWSFCVWRALLAMINIYISGFLFILIPQREFRKFY